jgi:2,3-dihydro-2,3-dihydroxybenzoate dehydrogenase
MELATSAVKLLNFGDKVVWITGAGQGIGYHTALAFHNSGAIVEALDIKFHEGTSYPFRCHLVNISSPDSVNDCCTKLIERYPSLDILVNCAGILRTGKIQELKLEDLNSCLAVNVGGAFNMFQSALPIFQKKRSGVIITVSSNAAHVPRVGMSAYCASKAALRSLCLTVGLEMASYGVRCNIISPGSTDTDMQRSLWKKSEAEETVINGSLDQYKLGIPLKKIAKPYEIAESILFFASDLASHITLQDMVVDGGATLGA